MKRISLLALALVGLVVALKFWPAKDCLVVDSDGSFDDVRALAWLQTQQKVDFIVWTEGVSRSTAAAAMFETFLKQSQVSRAHQPKIILGNSSHRDIDPSWQRVRLRDEKLNSLFSQDLVTPVSVNLETGVQEIERQCDSLKLLILGPYTSARQYWPTLQKIVDRAVSMGREDLIDFNCWYDPDACHAFFEAAHGKVQSVYLPDHDLHGKPYRYSQEDVERLKTVGMSGVLKKAFLRDPDGWKSPPLLMWDDLTAIYLFQPQLFVYEENWWQPNRSADVYKKIWLEDLNEVVP